MNPNASTLYIHCPKCNGSTLILREGSDVVCAACRFDYVSFSSDSPAFESYLVARMRGSAFEKLAAIALHQWVTRLPPADASAAIRAMAGRHGISLPDPASGDPVLRAAAIFGTVVVLLVLGLVLAAVLGS